MISFTPCDNEPFTRIQGLNPSSTCIPLQEERSLRRQDDERRHSDLYSRVKPVIYSDLVVLSHWQLSSIDEKQTRSEPSPQPGRLWAKSRRTALRTKAQVSAPSRKKCEHLRKRASRPRRVQGKPRRRRQDQRSSTSQGKDNIDKTTRMVIDTVDEADDKWLTSLDQWTGADLYVY